jgi:hypothetical protein
VSLPSPVELYEIVRLTGIGATAEPVWWTKDIEVEVLPTRMGATFGDTQTEWSLSMRFAIAGRASLFASMRVVTRLELLEATSMNV